MIPAWGCVVRRAVSVAAEPPRQLDVEGVQVDVADALEELGGPGVGQTLGQTVAPGLVLGLQLAEHGDGVGPLLRPRPSVLRRPRDRDGADGLAGGAALPESALALGVREGHARPGSTSGGECRRLDGMAMGKKPAARQAPPMWVTTGIIGYFEGLSSERGIAWRVADSLSLRAFLDLEVTEATPNHSTLSRTRRLIDLWGRLIDLWGTKSTPAAPGGSVARPQGA